MTDKFHEAIAEVGDYIASGLSMDEAVAEVAPEFNLGISALKNRAERRIGDIDIFRAMKKEEAIRERVKANERRSFMNRSYDSEMVQYSGKRRP